jgi:hypothetical protein
MLQTYDTLAFFPNFLKTIFFLLLFPLYLSLGLITFFLFGAEPEKVDRQ